MGLEEADGLDDLLGRIEGGLDAARERRLREGLGLSLSEMATLLNTSPRTLGRRQEEGSRPRSPTGCTATRGSSNGPSRCWAMRRRHARG
jgi:hypothetical protein